MIHVRCAWRRPYRADHNHGSAVGFGGQKSHLFINLMAQEEMMGRGVVKMLGQPTERGREPDYDRPEQC